MATRGKTKNVKWEFLGEEIVKIVNEQGEPALWAGGQLIKREAQARVPQRTSETRRSIYVETSERTDYRKGRRDRRYGRLKVRSRDSVLIATGTWYGNLLEDSGAGAHQIPYKGRTVRRNGSRRKVLKIPGVGYRRVVSHPGMHQKPFLGPALDAVQGTLAAEMAGEYNKALERGMPNA